MRIKVPNKNKLIRWIVALCIVLLVTMVDMPQKKLQYDIVVLGDSIIGNVFTGEEAVTDYIEKRLQKKVFRGAFGGSSMSASDENLWGSVSSYEWSMVKLAQAIAYDDWKSQKAAMAQAVGYQKVNNQALSYFGDTMATLQQIDFAQVEVLLIEHGTNDYNAGIKVDNPADPYDITTFGGALRESLRMLQESYPEMRIVIVSPIYCVLGADLEKTCDNTKYGVGGYLEEYVMIECEIAKEFQVEWIDAYHESGIDKDTFKDYLSDGLHLNEAGRELLGNYLAEYLENNKQ